MPQVLAVEPAENNDLLQDDGMGRAVDPPVVENSTRGFAHTRRDYLVAMMFLSHAQARHQTAQGLPSTKKVAG